LNLSNQRGTALLEGVVSLPLFGLLISITLAGSYLAFARMWLHHESYEALICLATTASVESCENRLREKTHAVLKIGDFYFVNLYRDHLHAELHAQFRCGEKIQFHLRDSLRLPLLAGGLR
jgi:hypothetical protein